MKGMPGMSGGMAQLMKQANQMQLKMKKAQEEIAKMEFEGTSGGGAVKVKVSGEHLLLSVAIDHEVIKAGDAEMMQDMVVTASNDAIKKAKEYSEKEMAKITGGMGIPGMF
ncbi:MAG: YbaB/EbfC family nucleoid-associated protein [Pseudobdellovibrionaceae bacterium]